MKVSEKMIWAASPVLLPAFIATVIVVTLAVILTYPVHRMTTADLQGGYRRV